MEKNYPIYFFVIASILAVIAIIINNDLLLILSKPPIIPSLGIYYFTQNRKKVNLTLVAILFIYFISDTILLLNIQSFTIFTIILDFIPYILLLKIVLQDAITIGFSKKEFAISGLFFAGLFTMLCLFLNLLDQVNINYTSVIIFYGLILCFFLSTNVYTYLITSSIYSQYLLLVAIFSLVSDMLWLASNFMFKIASLNYIEFAFQTISYFYIVEFFIKKQQRTINNSI